MIGVCSLGLLNHLFKVLALPLPSTFIRELHYFGDIASKEVLIVDVTKLFREYLLVQKDFEILVLFDYLILKLLE